VEPVRLQILGHVSTDGDGRFFLPEVCEGPVQLVISFQGFSGRAQTIAGTTNVLLRLGPGGVELSKDNGWVWRAPPALKIRGTVLDPSGAPASGVLLRLWGDWPECQEVKTDLDGHYTLELAKESFDPGLTVFARDLRRNLTAKHKIGDKLSNVDLTLEPGIMFSINAQDVNGLPIQSAKVSLTAAQENGNCTLLNYQLRTDENGLVEFKAMPRGLSYSADVTSREFNNVTASVPAEKTQTNQYTFHPAVLRVAERKLDGQVVGPDNKPIAGIVVVLDFDPEGVRALAQVEGFKRGTIMDFDPEVMRANAGADGIFQDLGQLLLGQAWLSDAGRGALIEHGFIQMLSRSDTDGRFSFDGLCEGTYHLLLPNDADIDYLALDYLAAVASDSSVELKLQAGDTNILVKLPPTDGVPTVVPAQP